MKTLIACLFTLLSFELVSTPLTHTIVYNTTTSVVCSVGDTLKFYATNTAVQGIQINSVTVITPAFPSASNYIGYYVVTGNESSYTFYNDINFHIDHTGSIVLANRNTGVFDNFIRDEIKLFPNPTHHNITLNSDGDEKIELFNANGKQVLSDEIHHGTNEINLSGLSPGTYFLIINLKSTKVIKY